jgi:hypothetical protein
MELDPITRDHLIRTVMSEAGDQSDQGKAAVAHVILNRYKSGQFGDSIMHILHAPKQFEPWSLSPSSKNYPMRHDASSKEYKQAGAIVDDALAGDSQDPTGGATHFLQEDIVRKRRGGSLPSWASGQGQRIGDHTFYGGKPPENAQQAITGALSARSKPPGATQALAYSPDENTPTPATPTAGKPGSLLDEWFTEPKAKAGSEPAAQAGAKPGGLLDEWFKPMEKPTLPETTDVLPPSRPAPPGTGVQDYELTHAAKVNKFLQEHQGPGLVNWAARQGGSAIRGMQDVGDTLAGGLVSGAEKGAGLLQRQGIISPESEAGVKDWGGLVRQRIEAGQKGYDQSGGSDIARVGGQIVTTAPMLGGAGTAARTLVPVLAKGGKLMQAILRGVGAGAGGTALTSSTSEKPLLEQMTEGGGIGGLTGAAGRGAAKLGGGVASLVSGHIAPDVAQLARRAMDTFGIHINPMQLAENSNVMRFAQSMLQRIPFTGFGPAAKAQTGQWEGALLKEIGQTGNRVTQDVIDSAKKDLHAVYDAIHKTLGPMPADTKFLKDIDRIERGLGPTNQNRIGQVLDDVRSKINKSGFMSGADHHAISEVDRPLEKALRSNNPDIAEAAGEIKTALRELLERRSPVHAAVTRETDYRWAVMRALEDARTGATGGISPQKLFNSFRKYEQGSGASRATQLGQIGQQFIKEPPSSSTVERLIPTTLGALGTAGLAGIGYHEFDPESWMGNALKAGAGAAALLGGRYAVSPTVRSKALTNLLINKALPMPGVTGGPTKLRDLLRATPVAAALGARAMGP